MTAHIMEVYATQPNLTHGWTQPMASLWCTISHCSGKSPTVTSQ